MDIDKVKDELNSLHSNSQDSNNESKENTIEVSMIEFMKIMDEGVKYANTFPEEDRECFSPNFRDFQKKMMKWTTERVNGDYAGKLIKKYPGKRTEIIRRIMALTAEGKSLENSLINH